MDRDDMENREIYVHDTQVSKREIEIAEENLHVKEIITIRSCPVACTGRSVSC